MADLLFEDFAQEAPNACVTDITAPTFSGISSLTPQANGALLASWSAAVDDTPPIEYLVYVQASTAVGLFSLTPILVSSTTSINIFTDSLGNLLSTGTTYHVGIRSKDAVGNIDFNSVSLSAVSLGVPATSILTAISQIWDQLRASHTVSGSFGEALQAKVDADVSTRAPAATAVLNSDYTPARAAKIDNLDAAISSRNAIAPDNAGIAAIKAKTDNLPSDPASESNVDEVKNLVIAGL